MSAAELFKALAHPARAQLVELLCRGPATAPQLRAATGLPQPNLSQQLAVLRAAGLVRTERSGRQVLYRIAAPAVAELMAAARSALAASIQTRIAAWTEPGPDHR